MNAQATIKQLFTAINQKIDRLDFYTVGTVCMAIGLLSPPALLVLAFAIGAE